MIDKAAALASVQQWMEVEVVGRGLCPPLVQVAQHHRLPDGKIDWETLSKEVMVNNLIHMTPKTEELLDEVSDAYLDFMLDVMDKTASLTQMFILPDFATNADFDSFLAQVKAVAFMALTSTQEGRDFARTTFVDFVKRQAATEEEIALLLKQDKGPQFMAQQVIEGCFNTIHFYGRRPKDEDLADLPDVRGPVERYKVLARAPYYVMQVVNPLRGNELAAGLNRPNVHKRNTTLALKTNVEDHERSIQAFRAGRNAR